MNCVFPVMMIAALVFGVLNGRTEQTVAAAFSGAEAAVNSTLAMAGVFCFWSGLLKIFEKSGFSEITTKIISPVICRIFPGLKKDEKAFSHICTNVAANIMGMGNAATPAGIEAMAELDRKNGYSPYASAEMCMFVVLNTASVQLIPTTVISLRSAAGSQNPAAVVVPIWIVSAISLVSAVLLMKLILKRRRV